MAATSFVTHLESAIDGTTLPADRLQTLHEGRPLWVRYDLSAAAKVISKQQLKDREPTMWRYRELLPIDGQTELITLGETMTPLLSCRELGKALGLSNLWIKDESRLPGGSFKSRGMAMAITLANTFGVKRVALPTAGNAGGAAAMYAARAGMETYVFMPEDTPVINQYECAVSGAHAFLVNGLITDCGKIVREGTDIMNWFDLSTLKEPYRIEGKKTMGLELAEQCDWQLPDVILYPTGGGTGLIGMHKAFAELAEIGWLESETRPKMVSCQSDGCAPIARAYEAGERFAEPIADAETVASGIRVPAAVGDFMILDAVRESGGTAVAVSEAKLVGWMELANRTEGIPLCPEAAACVGAAEKLLVKGWLKPDQKVVIFNTGAVQKYPEAMARSLPRLDHTQSIDYTNLGR